MPTKTNKPARRDRTGDARVRQSSASTVEVYRVDRMRVWNATREFIAHAELRAPEGKIFVVGLIAIEAHPMPKANRERRRVQPIHASGSLYV